MTIAEVGLTQAEMIVWLKGLQAKISNVVVCKMRPNLSGNDYYAERLSVTRKLTLEEFNLFRKIAFQFVVVPFSAQFGFNFGVHLFTHPNSPGLKPEHVFEIHGKYLPEGMGDDFEGAWNVLSLLSHNHQNRERLQQYGMNVPREKSFFKY